MSQPMRRLPALLLILMAALALPAGCTFDSGLQQVTCTSEGARDGDQVCRDGYWQETDAGLDGGADALPDTAVDTGADTAADTSPDTGDACLPADDQALCEQLGNPCGSTTVADPCADGERTVDCSPFADTSADVDNCGACGNACTAGTNAEPVCSSGTCDITCLAGFVDVNGDPADGCELACTPSNGGEEICDDLDNDCDGQVDEEASDASVWYPDTDSDGYGDQAAPVTACDPPDATYIAIGEDCADDSPQVNPNAAEVCDGIVDDNCDGTADENCPCTNGQTRDCGPATEVGECVIGTQTCTDGAWADCQGATGPTAESCNGLDDNCDGSVDEDWPAKGDTCTRGVGECQANGTRVCRSDGSGLRCNAQPGASTAEVCDGLDNDCDGTDDNGFAGLGQGCTDGIGACEASGTNVCSADQQSVTCDAQPSQPAVDETCDDGIDDDCNGMADDGCQCDVGGNSTGVCSAGTISASDGSCTPPATYEAQESSCDGDDNDCDGVVDEGCQCNVSSDPDGECAKGTVSATDGSCTPPTTYETGDETLCDGLDNDCDGQVDESLEITVYLDDDGDGFGDAGNSTTGCDGVGGYVADDTDCDDADSLTYPGAPEICDGVVTDCNNTGNSSTWCQNHFGNNNLSCDQDGPSNAYCCEASGDSNSTCDHESICFGDADEDNDNLYDCADPDCDTLRCGDSTVCNHATGLCEPVN